MELKKRITRVSQIVGELNNRAGSDMSAFDAIETITSWTADKAKLNLTEDQSRGNDLILKETGNDTVEAFRITTKEGSFLWMLQYSHPCQEIETRTWITEFAVGNFSNGLTKFGVRLNYRNIPDADPKKILNVPRAFRELVDKPGVIIDGHHITGQHYGYPYECNAEVLDKLIESPTRSLPIVLVSEHRRNGFLLDPKKLARDLAGIALIYALDNVSAFNFRKRLGRRYSAYNGSIRIIKPDTDSHYPDNPYFLHDQYIDRKGLLKFLVSKEVFACNLDREISEHEFPTFAHFKKIFYQKRNFAEKTRRLERITAKTKAQDAPEPTEQAVVKEPKGVSDLPSSQEIEELRQMLAAQNNKVEDLSERLSCSEEENKTLQETLKASEEEIESALSLAADEEVKNRELKAELEETRQELDELAAQTKKKVSTAQVLSMFPPLAAIQSWTEMMFPNRLIVTNGASKAASKSPFKDPDLCYRSLSLLAGPKLDMYRGGGE